jgi:hypothetical protein
MHIATEAERLSSLARVLVASANRSAVPLAVGVVEKGDAADLWLNEMAVPDLAAAFRGFEAPDDWWAFGVACAGTVVRLDHPDHSRLAGEPVVHLVSRSGASISCVGGQAMPPLDLGEAQPIEGRLADACRRVLQIPTPPPPADTRLLFALQWLDSVSQVAFTHVERPLAWHDVVRMHPFADAVTSSELGVYLDDHVVEVGNAAGRAWSWSRLRTACAQGKETVPGLTAAEAAWADDGCFARMLLEVYPELDDLLVALGALLEPEVTARLEDALRGWGLA